MFGAEYIANIVRKVLQSSCCCNNYFGLTTLSPPVDEPGANGPFVLFNRETGEEWYWSGSAWLIANAGGTDTNLANTNLTADNHRTHNWDGFDLIIESIRDLQLIGDGSGGSITISAPETSTVSSFNILLGGGESAIFTLYPGGTVKISASSSDGIILSDPTGRIYIPNQPPVDAVSITHLLGINSAGNVLRMQPSGTYTPVISNLDNLESVAIVGDAGYMRVGNVVHVFGNIEINPDTTLVPSSFNLSLPVSSAMSSQIAAGIATTDETPSEVARIYSVGDGDVVIVKWTPIDTDHRVWSYHFTYLIE